MIFIFPLFFIANLYPYLLVGVTKAMTLLENIFCTGLIEVKHVERKSFWSSVVVFNSPRSAGVNVVLDGLWSDSGLSYFPLFNLMQETNKIDAKLEESVI